MEQLNDVVEVLNLIEQDTTVPKNVRGKVKTAIITLNDNGKPSDMKFDRVLQELDELSDDPNIPSYTRTQIWNVVSLLESMNGFGKRR